MKHKASHQLDSFVSRAAQTALLSVWSFSSPSRLKVPPEVWQRAETLSFNTFQSLSLDADDLRRQSVWPLTGSLWGCKHATEPAADRIAGSRMLLTSWSLLRPHSLFSFLQIYQTKQPSSRPSFLVSLSPTLPCYCRWCVQVHTSSQYFCWDVDAPLREVRGHDVPLWVVF